MNTPLAALFRYNRWANLALLDACRPLSDAQLGVATPDLDGRQYAEAIGHGAPA